MTDPVGGLTEAVPGVDEPVVDLTTGGGTVDGETLLDSDTSLDGETVIHTMFGRDSLYVVVLALQLVTAVVLVPVITRVLGPDGYGRLATAVALSQAVFPAAALGLQIGIQRVFAGPGGRDAARGLLTVSIVLTSGVVGLLLVTRRWWGGTLGLHGHPAVLELTVVWSGLVAVTYVDLALLRSLERLGRYATVSLLQSVGIQVVALGAVAVFGRSAQVFLAGYVAGQALALVVALALTRPRLSGVLQVRTAQAALVYSLPLVPQQVATFVLNASDRLVVQRDLGPVPTGRYQVAYNVGGLGIILLTFINQAWMPRIFALRGDARAAVLARCRDQIYRLLLPVVTGMALGLPAVLRVWAPASYRPGSLALVTVLVVASTIPYAASLGPVRVLLASGHTRTLAGATAAAAAANIALNLLLVPTLGIDGSALATLVSFALLAALVALLARSAIPVARVPAPLGFGLLGVVGVALASAALPTGGTWFGLRLGAGAVALAWLAQTIRTVLGRSPRPDQPRRNPSCRPDEKEAVHAPR
jgi:O-antigen/teichoic acid export membrane protein